MPIYQLAFDGAQVDININASMNKVTAPCGVKGSCYDGRGGKRDCVGRRGGGEVGGGGGGGLGFEKGWCWRDGEGDTDGFKSPSMSFDRSAGDTGLEGRPGWSQLCSRA